MRRSCVIPLVIAAPLGAALAQNGPEPAGDPVAEPAPQHGPLAAPLVPHPHPLISEILFAVPTERGDANHDGQRHVSGDEFVELINPHDEPIELAGYALRDSAEEGPRRLEFAFPQLTLGPGQCAVVFNGHDTKWHGPVGDEVRAPIAPHPWFAGAHVFTARSGGSVNFANSGDFILLTAPSGEAVQCVTWGTGGTSPVRPVLLEEVERVTEASLQREAVGGLPMGALVPHDELDGRGFSPGEAAVTRVEAVGEEDPLLVGPERPDRRD